jgi:hypothetical protein
MHTLACATSTFFAPAFTTSLRLLTIDKLLAQFLHTVAILYSAEAGSGQVKLVTVVVYQFVIG